MRIQYWIALFLVGILYLATGCATYTGCNEAFYENLPGCPAQPVKLESCQISA